MLNIPTPFGQVGSFALFIDPLQPIDRQFAELVRIQGRVGVDAFISWPLRDGAGGNRTVPLAELHDATPLTAAEREEMEELQAHCRGRTIRRGTALAAKQARADELRHRHIMSQVARIELAKLPRRDALAARRTGASAGARLPREIAA